MAWLFTEVAHILECRRLRGLVVKRSIVLYFQMAGCCTYRILARVPTGKNEVAHVGINYRYGVPEKDEIRLRSRPEADPSFHFIDTGKFPSDYSNHVGGEAYYSRGPLMLGTEFYWHGFQSAQANNPTCTLGGEVVASYMITGESRPYHTSTAILGFLPVKKSVFKGGPGAWEVLVRASTLDLNGGTIQGGKFWRITPMAKLVFIQRRTLGFSVWIWCIGSVRV
ncbi:MAG: porin [Cytophagales bacterium]|nr:porin [Cytophagales bacterium]